MYVLYIYIYVCVCVCVYISINTNCFTYFYIHKNYLAWNYIFFSNETTLNAYKVFMF